MKEVSILLVIVIPIVLVMSVLALNTLVIKVKLRPKLTEIAKRVNKLRVEIIPNDIVVGERVEIIVRDPENNPAEGVKVYIIKGYYNTSKEKVYLGETDSSGKLVHVFEERGWYRVYVEKRGCYPQEVLIYVRPKGCLSISVKFPYADVEEDDVNKWLAVIYVTSDNYPVEGVEVYVNGELIGYTDDNGRLSYVFKPEGVYTVVVKKKGYVSSSITLSIKKSKG